MPKLVIVESPAKAKTIGKFLGSGYVVRASLGHVRDLPPDDLGVDIEHGFAPTYHLVKGKGDTVRDLKERAAAAEQIYLATDPDREGEAIAWHVLQLIKPGKGKPVQRVAFHEITQTAIQDAFRQARSLDMDLVHAQQARRILDRLVGYQVSPILNRRIQRGLSAGRVQSVAVRLVVEREREIQDFKPEEYWTVEADLAKLPVTPAHTFRAILYSVRGQVLGKFGLRTHDDAQAIIDDLQGASYHVQDVVTKRVERKPQPPFITSTMQREASSRLGLAPAYTMTLAQQLYEGIDVGEGGAVGLITYMRTDSPAVAPEAQAAARDYIRATWGEKYLPARSPVYEAKGVNAQEAHEAIRPTDVERAPAKIRQYLNPDQFRLYELIWRRFLASQMAAALLDQTTVDVAAGPVQVSPAPYVFRATGSEVIFPGWLAVYEEEPEEEGEETGLGKKLPELARGELLELLELLAQQHWTEPPPRYNEATLIKELEKRGIGRPSTYAGIMETIQRRGYVEKQGSGKKKAPLFPTPVAFVVIDFLIEHFAQVMDYGFTCEMEERLDQIAAGRLGWVQVLQQFYAGFEQDLQQADGAPAPRQTGVAAAGLTCNLCGKPMVVRTGKQGEFLACSGYPACRNAKEFMRGAGGEIMVLDDIVGTQTCDRCGQPMKVRKGPRGYFLGCSGYPACNNTRALPGDYGLSLAATTPAGSSAAKRTGGRAQPARARSAAARSASKTRSSKPKTKSKRG